MSELRQNLATRDWVIVAPERLRGRKFLEQRNVLMDQVPSYVESCPFCPANESRYENVEVEHVPHPDTDNSTQSPWLARCIENKYKIFEEYESCPIGPAEFDSDGIYSRFMGCGSHELILESPVHNDTFATMSQVQVEHVVRLYSRRFEAIRANPNNLLCMIFKNHGPRSGASQIHPHSQILGMRVVPNALRSMLDEAARHFDSKGICVFCRMLRYELEEEKRLVYKNNRFVAYVPYAASVPYETHIFPIRHDSLFGDMEEEEITAFADCLRQTMAKIYHTLSNPDFNLLFRNPPYPLSNVPYYHWHVQVVPRTKTDGGFEKGSGIGVNVVPPEYAAEHLRSFDTI